MGDGIPTNTSFTSLPNEVISIILLNNECRDILNFGQTCKQFNEIVNNDQYLWKAKFKSIVHKDVFHLVELHCDDGNWFNKVKNLLSLKKTIYTELLKLSPKCYWYTAEINLQDLAPFFTLALSNNINYYYTVKILQDLIIQANQQLDEFVGVKPFTLTEIHYAKVVLSHLMHLYLCVEWVQKYTKGDLHPDVVLNFFIRWTEVDILHDDEEVSRAIAVLVNKVENKLKQISDTTKKDSIKEKCAKKEISEREILSAISNVIYNQENIAVVDRASVYTLDPVQVLANRCGHSIAVAAIYQSVARQLSVPCDVIAFPNHLYLEWRDAESRLTPRLYRINLDSGELEPRRICPFSPEPRNEYKYSPDLLLQYIFSSFTESTEGDDNWHMKNAATLLAFLQTEYPLYHNPLQNYHILLRQDAPLHLMPPLTIKYIPDEHKHVVEMLSNLTVLDDPTKANDEETDRHNPENGESQASDDRHKSILQMNRVKPLIVKTRASDVKYAVGMICSHKTNRYVCVINGWEPTCYRHWHQSSEISSLQFGGRQPFYDVYVRDQTKRYVAQEHLVEVMDPVRLNDLEDTLGQEFTHFNGFSYAPNDEKRMEYPGDDEVRMMYHSRASKKDDLDDPSCTEN